eukprot:s2072_g11.t1
MAVAPTTPSLARHSCQHSGKWPLRWCRKCAPGAEQWGGELARALFALAQHGAVYEAQGRLQAREFLATLLDNLHVIEIVETGAGIVANLVSTALLEARLRLALRSSGQPGGAVRIGEADLADRGFVALGVPSCCAERVRTVAYWAAWADALPFTRQRRPDAATRRGRELAAAGQRRRF